MASITIHLGDEDDDALKASIRRALKTLKARRVGFFWGLGGSQEIRHGKFKIRGKVIVVEAETYVGITVSGDEATVRLFEAMVLES